MISSIIFSNRLYWIVPLLILFPSYSWQGDLQYIYMSIVGSVFLLYDYLVDNKNLPVFSRAITVFFGFSIVGIVSMIYHGINSNGIFEIMALLSTCIFVLFLRINKEQRIYLVNLLAIVSIIYLLAQLGLAMATTDLNNDWVQGIGANWNASSAYVVILAPFVLSADVNFKYSIFFKMVYSFLVFLLIAYTKSEAVLVSFILLFCVRVGLIVKDRFSKSIFIVILSAIVALFGYIMSSKLFDLVISPRIYLLQSSWQLFIDSPLFGHGLGLWFDKVYSSDLSNIIPFNDKFQNVRFLSHNLFTKYLVEVGLIGTALFFIPFYQIIRKIKQNARLIEDPYYQSILVFLLLSMVYGTVYIQRHLFVPSFLVVIISISVLDDSEVYIHRVFYRLALCLSIVLIVWFGLSAKYNHDFFIFKNNDNTEKRISIIQKMYHPILNHSHDNLSLYSGILAKEYSSIGDYKLAEAYYLKALNRSPNNVDLLLGYAELLIDQNKELDKCEQLLMKSYGINNKYFRTKYLLALHSYKQGNLNECIEYLDDFNWPGKKFLMDYRINYRERVIELRKLCKEETKE